MITYSTAKTDKDLQGILDLQQRNLLANISYEESRSQGFVTVQHTLEDLHAMNTIEEHIIAKEGDNVVAYLLAMTKASRNDIPVLVPMFDAFEKIDFRGRRLSDHNLVVVGQACVDKRFRGLGIFDATYAHYATTLHEKYDFAVTEIASSNMRSQRAHERIGFKSIHQYLAPDSEEWNIVLLDWPHRS